MDFSSEPGPKMGCVVRGRAPVTSLSYHESGEHLFIASEKDSVLRIVDCVNGGSPKDRPSMIKMQREGIKLVESTHHGHCVLFSPGMNGGVPKKNNVYYHSIHGECFLSICCYNLRLFPSNTNTCQCMYYFHFDIIR